MNSPSLFALDAQDLLPWLGTAISASYLTNESFLEAAFAFNGALGVFFGLEIGNQIGGTTGAAIGAVALPTLVEGKVDQIILLMAGTGFVLHQLNKFSKSK